MSTAIGRQRRARTAATCSRSASAAPPLRRSRRPRAPRGSPTDPSPSVAGRAHPTMVSAEPRPPARSAQSGQRRHPAGATCAASATDRATVSDAVVSSADAGENEVLLVRVEVARRARQPCAHAGRPIDEGDIADGCITCPYHGSTFRSAAARSRGPGCVTAAAIRRARARRSGRGTRPPLTPSSSIILNG